ncbi:MAG TPA: ABC transporter permease [Kineosporiaceae bacterium]
MSTRTTLAPSDRRVPSGAAEQVGALSRALTGTGPMTRLALRRDRVLIPVWLAVFVGMAGSTASSTLTLYPDIVSRRGIATTINGNPAMLALYGRIADIDSAGAVAMFKVNAMGAALVAVLAAILLVRHTRAEEEAGRLELVGAGVVGRLAPLTAALIVSAGTAVLLGLLTAAALVGAGLPVSGSLAFGLSWALTGVSFTAVAAIMAQLTTNARTANGLTGAVLGATYLLRAVGDIADADGPRWASWLSPVGWAQQVRPFAGERWWVFGLGLAFVIAAAAAAYWLAAHRDVGAGLLADRAGPGRAGPRLRGVAALAVRLQRGTLLAWSGALLLMGLVVGSLGRSIDAFLGSPSARDMIARMGGTGRLVDAFFGVEQGAAAIIVSLFAIQSVLRLRAEETGLRAEPLLATAVGRRTWVASHLTVAVVGSLGLLLVVGAGMGLTAATTLHDAAWFPRLLGGQLEHAPAVLVMIGITLAAFGLVPRLATAGWVLLVVFLLIGELGPIFQLDQRVLDVSPFVHVPRLGTFDLPPLAALLAVAAALMMAGLEGFRRRDLQ